MLLLLCLLLTTQSRLLTFTAVGSGSDMIADFIDPFSYMANNSKVLTDKQRAYILSNAATADASNGAPLENCILNHRTGVSTCDNSMLFYPYYIKYDTVADSDHPERVGRWVGEEYGWMTIMPPNSTYNLTISSWMVYHYPGVESNNEMFLLSGIRICAGVQPPLFPFVSTQGGVIKCGTGNYTLSDNKWYVTMKLS